MNPGQVPPRRFPNVPFVIDTNPLAVALNTRMVSLDQVAGVVRLAFNPGSQFVQSRGVLQGGIVSTLLDFAAAYAALAILPEGQTVATATITVNFQSVVKAGEVVATGMVESAGKRLIFARAQINGDGDRILADATSVLAILPDGQPQD
jgi:uncharacterized protein (TIGR00369 family)